MDDILKILLSARLDSKNLANTINTQLTQVEAKINKLNIDINIKDADAFKVIENLNKELSKLGQPTGKSSGATTEALNLNKVYDSQITKIKVLKGTFSELKGELNSGVGIAKALSESYGGLEVRGHSLNKTSGQYSATLRQSAKENLILKGTIDRVTGSLYVQSEQVVQARNVQLGFFEQLKIAMQRVPKMNGDYKLSLINWGTPNVKTRTIHNKQDFIICAVATTE